VSGTVSAKERLRRIPGYTSTVETMKSVPFHATRLRRGGRIDAYLAEHPVRKLHLGAGYNVIDGWLNTDVDDHGRRGELVYLDARRRFPLPDDCMDVVFTEHMVEHLSYSDGLHCLRECRRVLKPEGRLRIATPSLDRLVRLWDRDEDEISLRYVRWSVDTFVHDADAYLPAFVLNNFMRDWGHRFVYDQRTLAHALETAGFVDVVKRPVGESDDARLAGLEQHGRLIPPEFNAFETLVLEARRP